MFCDILSVFYFRRVWQLSKIPDLLEILSTPSLEVEDPKHFPKLIDATSHKAR